MTNAKIFLESFMYGFTMSGFLSKLEQPGVLPLLAKEEPEGISDILLERVHDLLSNKIKQLIDALSEEMRLTQSTETTAMPDDLSMLPTPKQLIKLSDDKVKLLVGLADQVSRRRTSYAIVA